MNSSDKIVIERTFNAPLELIWELWTKPSHFQNWYGPKGATIPVAKMDLKIGGQRIVCMEMQRPNGSMKMWTIGEFIEITPNKRLVYSESMSDENGRILSASEMGMPEGFPMTTEVIIELEDIGGSTKMTMTHVGVSENQGASGGWNQAFDKMADYINTINSNK